MSYQAIDRLSRLTGIAVFSFGITTMPVTVDVDLVEIV